MKGVVNTIEALIGAIMILGLMIFLFTPQPMQEPDMYRTSYTCLKYAKDSENIKTSLDQCIPDTYKFDYRICETADCPASGLVSSLPENTTIVSAEYIDSGPRLIKIWVYK